MEQAEREALRNHPRLLSAELTARAASAVVAEARSAFFPTLSGNLTAAGAEPRSVVEAGALSTSSLYSRAAGGLAVNQLVTDFGRTSDLAESARLGARARSQSAVATRAEVVLDVRQAYAQALEAKAVLKVASATVEYRRTALRQIQALAQSSLRSTLDVSFSQVLVSEAELLSFRAENDSTAAEARLAAAMGLTAEADFELVDEPLPPAPAPRSDALVGIALKQRPDVAALRLDSDAALRLAQAEKRLSYPTVNLLAVGGGAPEAEAPLRGTYAAAGVNMSVPIFNGGLFAARRSEAELRAAAVKRDVDDLSLRVTRDVRVAWLEANDAWRRLDVTARLTDQANQAVRLAQARYDAGLGGIVELNQAQLAQTSAQIDAAAAKYEYMSRIAELDFVTGNLR